MIKSKLVKTEAATNMMEHLPQEIKLKILSRLPVTSLPQSMLVCRAWRSLIQDPLLVSNHFSHMANKGPSFIFQSNPPTSAYQVFFIDFSDIPCDGNVMVKKLPTPAVSGPKYLVDSCNGLLCMRDTRGLFYIYNPFTRAYLVLPYLSNYMAEVGRIAFGFHPTIYMGNYPAEVGHIAFGFHPTINKYKVVWIVHQRESIRRGSHIDVTASTLIQYQVHVVTIGDPSWRNIGMLPYDLTWPLPKALVNGRLHWLSVPNKYTTCSLLVSFDLATEQFQEVTKPDCCGIGRCFHHLMVLGGCLSAVAYRDNEQMEIWVMKENGIKESWIKEFTIGAYLPQALRQNEFELLHNYIARAPYPYLSVTVLGMLKNGEILLEYGNRVPFSTEKQRRVLVLYDPQHGAFKELTFPEMPNWYKIVVQVGSLNWIDTPINF